MHLVCTLCTFTYNRCCMIIPHRMARVCPSGSWEMSLWESTTLFLTMLNRGLGLLSPIKSLKMLSVVKNSEHCLCTPKEWNGDRHHSIKSNLIVLSLPYVDAEYMGWTVDNLVLPQQFCNINGCLSCILLAVLSVKLFSHTNSTRAAHMPRTCHDNMLYLHNQQKRRSTKAAEAQE